MKSRASLKRAVAAVAVGVLIGGGVTTITPAGAEVSQFAGTNWKKIWKKKLQPQADKRYYTKAASNARYVAAGSVYSKAEVEAKLGGYYTKAQTDAKYQPVGNYAAAGSSYTKAESDAKYAPAQPLFRGSLLFFDNAAAAGSGVSESFSFGATFPSAPIGHFIPAGAALPAGCSGTAQAPNAAAGHLCVFGTNAFNTSTIDICSGAQVVCGGSTDPFGASIYVYAAGAGQFGLYGTWAARPSGPVVNPAFAPAPKGATNSVTGPQGSGPGTS